MGGDRKLMFFHLEIYVILFNSFCLFLLEHIDVFWMFLLLPATKNKTIIQNKQKINNQSHPPVERDYITNQWKLFKPNRTTRQLSFCEFKIFRTLQQNHTLALFIIRLDFYYKYAYLGVPYIVILTDSESFSPGTVLPSLH